MPKFSNEQDFRAELARLGVEKGFDGHPDLSYVTQGAMVGDDAAKVIAIRMGKSDQLYSVHTARIERGKVKLSDSSDDMDIDPARKTADSA